MLSPNCLSSATILWPTEFDNPAGAMRCASCWVSAANQKAKQRRYREAQPESTQFKLQVWTSRPADPRSRLGGAQRVLDENQYPAQPQRDGQLITEEHTRSLQRLRPLTANADMDRRTDESEHPKCEKDHECGSRSRAGVFQNNIGGLFADHDCWRVGVASRDCGYDRGVNDPQPRHTAYPQPRIDDRLLIRSHAAGADRMQIGDAISADGNLKLFVGIDSSAT